MEFEEPENDSMDEVEEEAGFEYNEEDDEFDEENDDDEENYQENATGVALWRAAASGDHQEITRLLQTTDVDPNYKHYTAPQYDEFLRPITPLFAACSRGHAEAVRALLADPRTLANFRLDNRASALHFAAIVDSVDCLRLVLEAKNAPLLEAGERSALHYACLRGQIAAANFLTERGAPIDVGDFCGQTPLFYAAYQGKTAMCKFLVSKGANPNAVDQDGEIPLFDAALAGMLSTVQYFVEETNTNLLHLDNQGRTAFDVADAAQMSEVALYLWRKGVPSNQLKKSSYVLSTSRLYAIDGPGASVGLNAGIAGNTLYICGGQRLSGTEVEPVEDLLSADISQTKAINLLGHYNVQLPPPTELCPHRMGQLLTLVDPLRVRYVGNESDWASSVQATRPMTIDDGVMYFEVFVGHGGTRNEIAIGITHGDYSINDDLPGWNPISWALHGDNGNIYHNNGYGHGWATRIYPGDTVGCGLIRQTREIFFTLNGHFLGVAFVAGSEEINRDLFATVGLRGDGSEVSVNFGDKPFKFDFYVDALQFQKHPGFLKQRRHVFAANKYFVALSKGLSALHRFCVEDSKLERIPVISESPLPQANTERLRTCAIGSTVWVYVVPAQRKKTKRPMKPVLKLWSINLESGKAEKHKIDLTHMQRDLPPNLDVGVDLPHSGNRIFFFQPKEFCSFYVDLTTLQAIEIALQGSFLPELECEDLGVAILAQKYSADGEAGNSTIFALFEHKYNDWLSPRLSGPTVRQRVGVGIASHDNTVFFISGYSDDQLHPDFDVCCLRDSSSVLMDSLNSMFESPLLSDVQLQFPGNQTVSCHKAILHARCSALRQSLSGKNTTQIAINVPFNLFRHVLKYIYTDTMDLNIDAQMTLSLADLFDKWIPEHALRACESIVLTRVATPSSMAKDIGTMALNPLYSDITLVVDGQEIVAHRCILARCGYFRAMFTSQLKESTQDRIEIPETSFEAFKIVLEYIYTQESDPTAYADIIVDVLITAARFGVEKLVHLLEGVIAHNLSIENACSLLLVSQQGFLRLGAAAGDFVRRHEREIKAQGHWLDEISELML